MSDRHLPWARYAHDPGVIAESLSRPSVSVGASRTTGAHGGDQVAEEASIILGHRRAHAMEKLPGRFVGHLQKPPDRCSRRAERLRHLFRRDKPVAYWHVASVHQRASGHRCVTAAAPANKHTWPTSYSSMTATSASRASQTGGPAEFVQFGGAIEFCERNHGSSSGKIPQLLRQVPRRTTKRSGFPASFQRP